MRSIYFLLAICFFETVFAQQRDFVISWDAPKTLNNGISNLKVPNFNEGNFDFDGENLHFVAQWEETALLQPNSAIISGITTSSISQNELFDLSVSVIPQQLEFSLKQTNSRGQSGLLLELSPIIKTPNGYESITSFSVSYQTSPQPVNQRSISVYNSVLSQGGWFRFTIDQSGIYKLNRDFLQSLGVNVTGLDPRTIKIYGYGGLMLPLENLPNSPMDPIENAIKVIGEDDGVFNPDDYVLFYGRAASYDQESRTHINAYTNQTIYYLQVGGNNGLRVSSYIEPVAPANQSLTSFVDYQFHELDEYNLANMGRRWFGERFDFDAQQDFTFNFPNLISGELAEIKVLAAATSEVNTTMSITLNNTAIGQLSFLGNNSQSSNLASGSELSAQKVLPGSGVTIGLSYNDNGNPASTGYLDYISIAAKRSLTYTGESLFFNTKSSSQNNQVVSLTLDNSSSVVSLWDVSDIENIKELENSNAASSLTFKTVAQEDKLFLTVAPQNFLVPQRLSNSTVSTINLKGTIFQDNSNGLEDVEYLILTREDMQFQAERLADIHRSLSGLNVKVVLLSDIYKEFNTGNPDIAAIRNFVKYVYDRPIDPSKRLKYVCLFGDGSFDYKDRISNNNNIVPSWYSYNSFNAVSSFVSDDFFGMMDLGEGLMANSDQLDIAIGRILADTPQRAKTLVDKIASYYTEAAYGSWRNQVVVISDDVDASSEFDLENTTNIIGDMVSSQKPQMNVTKIHSDAFVQESSSGGERYPEVNKAIFDAIELGALVVNYFGHGGEDGLAGERIFDILNAKELKNECKLNCFVTVTCEYTKFDNPNRPTAGEYLYWNSKGGAIGMLTTTRRIFLNVGVLFNVKLQDYLFGINGAPENVSMAEALRLTKTSPSLSGVNQRRLVFFIGDPAMKLALPKPEIKLTHINGTPVSGNTEMLRALDLATLKGEVVDQSGNILSNYNGQLTATIYDKLVERSTLGNDGTTDSSGNLLLLDFETLGSTIFKGQASISNGVFDFSFVVPRDIQIAEGTGKVSFYAKEEVQLNDHTGADLSVRIGGINPNASQDNVGPTINLFMNDESFISGGITNENPTLLVNLFDLNGINTIGGVGHDILATLDGDEANAFNLNDYYVANQDDFQNGTVNYPFRYLDPGEHLLKLKAWDVYNNSSEAEIRFVVYDENDGLFIDHVLNYPNPFINYTEFWFNHNSSEPLDIMVQIFSISGKLVKTLHGQSSGDGKANSALSRDITWDGTDDFGDFIGKGVYVYKLTVRSSLTGSTATKFEKLVKL